MIRLLIFLWLFSGSLQAQLALTTAYNLNSFPAGADYDGTEVSGLEDDFGELQLSYWFRLKNKRIEFLPTVYATGQFGKIKTYQEGGFLFKTNIYPFDFGGDCDCPTFGKQGPDIAKGFFIQLAPGFAYTERDTRGIAFRELDEDNFFVFAGGVGIDLGISNFLTLSPFAAARYQASEQLGLYPGIPINGARVGTVRGHRWTYQLGLQLLARFDHKRY